ncbi:Cation/H(+) antiporter, partial [Thalictrum thalictroides]
LIDYASYEVLCVSMLFVTAGLTPVVRYLFKSTIKDKHNRRTIQHSNPYGELRVMACIYEEENVPSIIHLLKATNPTKDSPINVSIVHFVELVGRATPLIISHKAHRKPSAATAVSQRIITVFKRYEENNRGSILVHPYTVVSPYASMHNDVCMLALHKRTTLIILPFHKQFVTGTISGGIKTVNCNVLEKSPCSVGILIDRGLLGGIKFVLTNWLSYHVAVVFLGGADDREALALGVRMSEHQTIELTVIRFLANYKKDSDPVEKSLDDEMVNDFKYRCAFNNRVTYIEEDKVKNGRGVINVLKAMADRYELIILGRRHDENSPLILELTEWNKSELGTMGDIFTTSGYGGKATILVMQQQTKEAEEEMQTRSQEEQVLFRKDDI